MFYMEVKTISIEKNTIIQRAKGLKPERKNVSFRIKSHLYDELMKLSENEGVSSANIVEALLEKLFEDKRH